MTKTVTFELSKDQAEFLEAAAEREARSVDEVVGDLVKQQMDYDAWVRRKAQEGIDAIERGEVFTHEEVVARAEARRAELIAKHAQK
jgi:predicted transcriptional regulator